LIHLLDDIKGVQRTAIGPSILELVGNDVDAQVDQTLLSERQLLQGTRFYLLALEAETTVFFVYGRLDVQNTVLQIFLHQITRVQDVYSTQQFCLDVERGRPVQRNCEHIVGFAHYHQANLVSLAVLVLNYFLFSIFLINEGHVELLHTFHLFAVLLLITEQGKPQLYLFLFRLLHFSLLLRSQDHRLGSILLSLMIDDRLQFQKSDFLILNRLHDRIALLSRSRLLEHDMFEIVGNEGDILKQGMRDQSFIALGFHTCFEIFNYVSMNDHIDHNMIT
jgi:hypothetical protein